MELNKRIITSLFLFLTLYTAINNIYIMGSVLIICFIQFFYEFHFILKKIFLRKSYINFYLLLLFVLVYLFFFHIKIFSIFYTDNFNQKILFFFVITICISSDIGGYIFGKIFKGKKLSKISPNKTYSGLIGSYIFSIIFSIIFFLDYLSINNIIIFCLILSSISQAGDLTISLLKRKAKIKDTSNFLPGHGGLLDRFDGLMFAFPSGFLIFNTI